MALLWQSVRLLLESLLESLPSGQHILQHRVGAAHLDVLTPGKTVHEKSTVPAAIRLSAPTAANLEQHFTPRDDQVWKREAKREVVGVCICCPSIRTKRAAIIAPSLFIFTQLPFTFLPEDHGEESAEGGGAEVDDVPDSEIGEPPLDDKQNFKFCFDLTNTGRCSKGIAVRLWAAWVMVAASDMLFI